jgi:hypothetical protein
MKTQTRRVPKWIIARLKRVQIVLSSFLLENADHKAQIILDLEDLISWAEGRDRR